MTRLWKSVAPSLLVLGLATAAGCLGHEDDGWAPNESALEIGIVPVGEVPERIWRQVQEGCEGVSGLEDMVFARAQNAPDLGVALDEDGQPVCVDSWQEIYSELDEILKGDPSPDPMDRFMKPIDE